MTAPSRELQDRLDQLAAMTVPPAVEHDANYWRGVLKVIAERQGRIDLELAAAQREVFRLGQLEVLANRARADAVVESRNLLTRAEVGRILGVKPVTITAQLRTELRRRGMGVQR